MKAKCWNFLLFHNFLEFATVGRKLIGLRDKGSVTLIGFKLGVPFPNSRTGKVFFYVPEYIKIQK